MNGHFLPCFYRILTHKIKFSLTPGEWGAGFCKLPIFFFSENLSVLRLFRHTVFMKKIFTAGLLISAMLTATIGFAQPISANLLQKVDPQQGKLVIPFSKYVLPNGLQVILHEDHSDPLVHVDVTYHVGSSREEIGRSGFAHFFEHMMFQGSDHVADEQHFKLVTEAGGTLNGTTNSDRTNYFETVPNNQLETALWLESDRMGFLLDAVTQRKFEVQRATVKNERGQNYDNRPYGLVNEKIARALYPYGHPYSWSTIGDLVDLDRVNVDDLKQFFMRWYGPNNATLTIAGDVNPEEALKLAEKYFGSIPRGPEVKGMEKKPLILDNTRYISYEDNIKFPLIVLSFPTVSGRHPDEAALDALAQLMGGTKNSIIYQTFIKSSKAIEAEASHPTMELAGVFELMVKAMPGTSLGETEKLLRACISDFEKTGFSAEALERFKATMEASFISSAATVSGKASRLAAYNTFVGNPDYIDQEWQAYKKLTIDDVKRVYNQYIKNKPSVVLSVVPKGMSNLVAASDNFTPKPTNPADADHKEYQGLSYKKPIDSFDRSKQPAPGKSPVMTVPTLWRTTFDNGLQIIGTQSQEIPAVSLQLSIPCGHRFEPVEKAGVAYLMAKLLDESTQKRSAEQISEALEALGSEISIFPGPQDVTINVYSLTKNLAATLSILEEKMFMPAFKADEFDRLKTEQLQTIEDQSTRPVVIANNVFSKLLNPSGSILALPTLGTAAMVKNITLSDVQDYYNRLWSANLSAMVVVGDVTKDALLARLEFLKKWQNKKVAYPDAGSTVAPNKTKLYLVNKEKAAQSEIRIGYLAMPFDATGDFYKSTIMNFPLGGAFNSRINLNLREDKGWTYGARSSFSGSRYVGPYTASAGVKASATDSSVVEFIKEINKFRETGITEEELRFTRLSLGQSEALKYESLFQKAGFLKRIVDFNLPESFTQEQSRILSTIQKPEIDALAKAKLDISRMVICVVGDKSKIGPGLSKLGYEVIELDANGEVVSGGK